MNVVDRINLRLAVIGKTGAEMSRDLGLSNSAYSQWNTGKTTPSNKTLALIAPYLETTVEYLLTGENTEKEKLLVNNDEELTEYLEMLKTRPETKMLFQLAKNATKEDVEKAVKIIEALRGE